MIESAVIPGAFVADRLVGVPSYHYDPIFAQTACRSIETLHPLVVALELPHGLEAELEWAAACWPDPVVSASVSALFPFVPGDSIFESYRSAKRLGIPVVLVDLPAAGQEDDEQGRRGSQLLGAEWARKASADFLQVTDALIADAGPANPRDLAREAHMARQLSQLVREGAPVLWVGGMAHWSQIVARIVNEAFESPAVDLVTHTWFRRMRLAPTALYKITHRLPWLVARYAIDPHGYDESEATQSLALEATKRSEDDDVVLIGLEHATDVTTALQSDDPVPPIDVARTLQYARNLAATGGLRERPHFGELLTAAAAMNGPRYAGRLYVIALKEHPSGPSAQLGALEWDVKDGQERYRCGDDVIDSKPWWLPLGGSYLSLLEVRRRVRDEIYKDLPPGRRGSRKYWECSADDEDNYVSFVEYVLRRASLTDPEEVKSVPFSSGLRDGLDVRATLRSWSEGKIYVREEQRGHLNFRNGAIDWTSASEHSEVLSGNTPGGWIDPTLTRLGSCSRESHGNMKVLEEDPWTQLDHREFSLITLDAPTSRPRGSDGGLKTFFDLVILPLVNMKNTGNDNLYGWLEVMFSYCAGKPFAYYSRYVPSPEVHRIAWKHHVRVVHFPLQRLPARLLKRHQAFRFFAFTRAQWEEFERRRSATRGTWSTGQPTKEQGERAH